MIEIDIKKDGEKQTVRYQPSSEIMISEVLKRKGVSIQQLADKLGYSKSATWQLVTGNPSLTSMYKLAWALEIDPRELFFAVDTDGNIVEEPKVNVQELLDEIERLKQGPLFSHPPQNAEQVMLCPNCGTAFLVTNVPRLERKKDTD